MSTITEGTHLSDILKWEQEKRYSREIVTVAEGNKLALGEVFGRKMLDIPTTGTADAGNTGNGAVTAVTGAPFTQRGTYTLTCIEAAIDGGTFQVTDPADNLLPNAVLPGTADGSVEYESEQINFTLNDGPTDFAVGDSFTIEVAAGNGEVVPLALTAVDGSQIAAGFPIVAIDATDAAVESVGITRDAVIDDDNLVLPDGITADQTAAVMDQLAARGIVARDAA